MSKNVFLAVAVVVATATAAPAASPVVITEWMYNPTTAGSGGEYFEITNISGSPVSMTGWSQDDSTSHSTGGPGPHSLSAFGTLQPGESAIGTEGADAAAFRSYWNLPGTVKVIAYGTSNNLGRADEINLYDSTSALVDRLTYDDQNGLGQRTLGVSGNIPASQLGLNLANLSVLSSVGDSYGAYRGGGGTGDLGNPGSYLSVPEPTTCVLLVLGATLLAARRQR